MKKEADLSTTVEMLCGKIIMLAIRARGSKRYEVFVDYAGHVESIDVRIRESGNPTRYLACSHAYIGMGKDIPTILLRLKQMAEVLRHLAEHDELALGLMRQGAEIHCEYSF